MELFHFIVRYPNDGIILYGNEDAFQDFAEMNPEKISDEKAMELLSLPPVPKSCDFLEGDMKITWWFKHSEAAKKLEARSPVYETWLKKAFPNLT